MCRCISYKNGLSTGVSKYKSSGQDGEFDNITSKHFFLSRSLFSFFVQNIILKGTFSYLQEYSHCFQ